MGITFLFGINSVFDLSFRQQPSFGFINSISFRGCDLSFRGEILSIRYHFGGMVIFPVENPDITGLISIFPGNKNDFSGLIIVKLSKFCRHFPKLLIVNLSFRLSIRCFFRSFVDIFREFVKTTGKIPKKSSDRISLIR